VRQALAPGGEAGPGRGRSEGLFRIEVLEKKTQRQPVLPFSRPPRSTNNSGLALFALLLLLLAVPLNKTAGMEKKAVRRAVAKAIQETTAKHHEELLSKELVSGACIHQLYCCA
jgi:hypothetical protein